MTINSTLRKHILDFHVDGIIKSSFAVYINLLFMASDRDKMLGDIEIKKGQCIISQKALAKRTGFTEDEVRGAIKTLVKAGYIKTAVPDKCTVYTVCAYANEEDEQETKDSLTIEQTHFLSLYQKKFLYQEELTAEEEAFFEDNYSRNMDLVMAAAFGGDNNV